MLDWNGDLKQYELLSDGASRGQFQQWFRAQAAQLARSDVRNLFARCGIADCDLMSPVTTDFGQRHQISTPRTSGVRANISWKIRLTDMPRPIPHGQTTREN